MRLIAFLLLCAAVWAQPALNGLGASTYFCVDRDGDGYGTGPVALGPFTDLVIDGSDSSKVTSASHSFITSDLYRVITVTGGTNFNKKWYLITGVSSGAATLVNPNDGTVVGTLGATGGQWAIYGCTGPDADDLDSTVHTAADVLTKHGTMAQFINSIAFEDPSTHATRYYTPQRIWLLGGGGGATPTSCTPANFNATCVPGVSSVPPSPGNILPGDLIMVRSSFPDIGITLPSGTSTDPVIIMSYPGETMAFHDGGIDLFGKSWIIVDGFQQYRGTRQIFMGDDTLPHPFHDVVVRHILGGPANFQGIGQMVGGYNVILEDSVAAHNNYRSSSGEINQAGVYFGCGYVGECHDFTVRRVIAYNNNYHGIHWNGIGSALTFTQNIAHSNLNTGFSFQSGMKDSIVSANLAFDNGKSPMELLNYKDNDSICGTAPCGTGPETGNLFINNTLVGNAPDWNACFQTNNGTGVSVSPYITNGPVFDMGHNTFRNNICTIAGYSYAPFFFTADTESRAQGYLATNVYDHNVTWTWLGAGTRVFAVQNPGTTYTCGTAPFTTGSASSCVTANPGFVAAVPQYPATGSSLDLSLSILSPPFHAGSTTGLPTYDLIGNAFSASTPSIGALELLAGWTDLTSTHFQDVCPGVMYGYDFGSACVKVLSSWGGGTWDSRRNRLIIWGGGHGDYAGNEVYALEVDPAHFTPSAGYKARVGTASWQLVRLSDPSDPATHGATGCTPETDTADHAPRSRHTYSGLVYLPTQDKMVTIAGSPYNCGNLSSSAVYTLDLSDQTAPITAANWAFKSVAWPNSGSPVCAYDPNTDTVVCGSGAGQNHFYRYTPSTNTFASVGLGFAVSEGGAAIDSKRKVFVSIGSGQVGYQIIKMNIGPGADYTTYTNLTSTLSPNCDPLGSYMGPGVNYDPVLDKIVAWPNHGNTVYIIDLDANTCTPVTYSGGPPHSSDASQRGTFGRFAYAPSLNKYVEMSNNGTGAAATGTEDGYMLTLSGKFATPAATQADPAPASSGGTKKGGKSTSGGKIRH